jgi:hypothetical protein
MHSMNRYLVLFAIIMMSLVASPVLADELFSIKGGYLKLQPDGKFAVSSGGVKGSSVDMDDLGFDDSENFLVEAALKFGSFRLYAAYMPVSFSGDEVLTQDINFNGETYIAGSKVDSDLDIDIYQAGLAWYLINVDDLPIRLQLGPELSALYIKADAKMKEDVYGLNESDSINVPLATIGLRGRIALGDYMGVAGRVGYLGYNGNTFIDADAQVDFSPVPMLGLFAGYRYLDIDIDESGLMIDATFTGPFAGAMVRF